jgi:hypothetical protein
MMKQHFRKWGAVYLLAALWLVSSIGQYIAMMPEIHQEGLTTFWAATFENWQSEFLQLAVQALVIVGAAKYIFTKSQEDKEELKAEIRRLRKDLRKNDDTNRLAP